MKPTKKNIRMMLEQSNFIEQVYDLKSLQDSVKAWDFISRFDSLNAQIIKETHKILMARQPISHYEKGEWRKVPVYIGYEKKSQHPLIIDLEVKDLVKKVNKIDTDPIQLHVEFEKIHPFIDGNGRIGRIIMNWHSVRKNNELIVFYDQTKQSYYRLFA